LRAAAFGEELPGVDVTARAPEFAVTTVIAAAGYPEQPRVGDVIELPPDEPGIHVFHAGTARNAAGELVTAGGRVLAVTAVGRDLMTAQRASAAFAGRVNFRGKHFRTDIASRGLGRHA
jgi:phosphoribosylamine---glycine ligase